MDYEPLRQEALTRYNLSRPASTFIRHNENITYRIDTDGASFLLRIHQPAKGFSLGLLDALPAGRHQRILAEMRMLLRLEEMGFAAQLPVPNKDGAFVTEISAGVFATLLTWINGDILNPESMTPQKGVALGRMMGKLHKALGNPQAIREARFQYDVPLMERIRKEMRVALAAQHITEVDEAQIQNALAVIIQTMWELDGMEGTKGLVHADLSNSNLIDTGRGFVPIDFSLSGYGYHFMELGMIFSQHEKPDVQRGILEGYEDERRVSVPLRHIQPFYALSVLLFIACQHGRFFREEWFAPAMTRWRQKIFEPLHQGKLFILCEGT